MSGGDHGFFAAAPGDQEVEDAGGAARVERGGGLIEQKDFGIQHDRRGDGDALLFPSGEAMRRAIPEVRDIQADEGGFHGFADFVFRPA